MLRRQNDLPRPSSLDFGLRSLSTTSPQIESDGVNGPLALHQVWRSRALEPSGGSRPARVLRQDALLGVFHQAMTDTVRVDAVLACPTPAKLPYAAEPATIVPSSGPSCQDTPHAG
jgi:hypothetical protein